MRISDTLANVILACLPLVLTGCSSLGLSCFPTGHFLTEQSEEVLNRSPRIAELPRELQLGVVPAHYLQPGDVLLVEPTDLESDVRIPADQQVMADGSVDLGGFGRVMVAGLTLEASETLMERTIEDSGHKPTRINVRLLEPIDRFYVLGEVNSPGSYPLSGHESVLDGILAAGGLTSAAAPCKILLARPTLPGSCRVTLPICYREITQLGDTSTNYQLQPGDRIFVATRSWCEELKFWEANKTCERCCGCQSACPDPQFASPGNLVAPPPAPGTVGVVPTTPKTVHAPETQAPGNSDRTILQHPATDGGGNVDDHSPAVAEPVLPPSLSTPERTEGPGEGDANQVDGELDFGVSVPQNRFEPLWITSGL